MNTDSHIQETVSFRHPYRLLAVLTGLLTVEVATFLYLFLSLEFSFIKSAPIALLAGFGASAGFILLNIFWDEWIEG